MDPDKQSESAAVAKPVVKAVPKDTDTPDDSLEIVMNERDAISLSQDLSRLLEADKSLDEHRAKQLRKAWDLLDPNLPKDSPTRNKLEQQFDSLRERIHRQVEARNLEFTVLENLLAELKQSVKSDDLQSSQQLEQKIISGLNRIQGLSTQRRQKVISGLEALQPRIKKLASWRHWGTEQAREKVITEIQQIHDHEKDLEKIAKRIQSAREEWKQWDQSGEGGDHKLYPVFDAACSKAYEPCKAHFDAQRKQRQAASKHRTVVCKTLETAYEETDWRNPDWKAVQQLVREQTARWRKLGPADYRDRKPLAKRYEVVISRFDGPLDRERKRNLKQRQDLIAQVEQLSDLEDTRKAISELQQLKKQWRVTVSGKRKQEQDIWKRFTAACDSIYNRGREAKKAFEQQLVEQLELKRKLCEEVESTLKEAPEDAGEVESRIRQWRAEWENTGRAPKNEARQIESRFRDGIKKMKRHLTALRQSEEAERDENLFLRAEICAAVEQQLIDAGKADIDAARESFNALPDVSGTAGENLASRFAAAEEAAADPEALESMLSSLSERFDTLNGYLLQLEINAGVDSPAEFSKQRMALQIGRLSAAIGKGADSELLDIRTLIEKIHTTGAVTPERQIDINQRFQACYQALQTASP